jgi:hypothetical protein
MERSCVRPYAPARGFFSFTFESVKRFLFLLNSVKFDRANCSNFSRHASEEYCSVTKNWSQFMFSLFPSFYNFRLRCPFLNHSEHFPTFSFSEILLLSNNELSGTIPHDYGRLSSLVHIDVR